MSKECCCGHNNKNNKKHNHEVDHVCGDHCCGKEKKTATNNQWGK
ncbi:hypothetical protein [Clostridium septicum]|nr:hypothetical protein [Clostridium septicum]MDU1314863.1 hypothetical protein [Clostridium septicum]WLF70524.1 hypothetical protein Q6375_05910 [Clostridium septicum]